MKYYIEPVECISSDRIICLNFSNYLVFIKGIWLAVLMDKILCLPAEHAYHRQWPAAMNTSPLEKNKRLIPTFVCFTEQC